MTTTSALRRSALALTLTALCSGTALAQTRDIPAPAAPPPPPEHTLTANIGLFSEYIFRGISQTGGKPAVQGGFDYAHASGFYAGTWASNISWLEDFQAYNRSSLEWDFYGGYKNTVPGTGRLELRRRPLLLLLPRQAEPEHLLGQYRSSSTARSAGSG
jgi:uncharacterized protein (TIGR02001 family)